MVSGGCDVEGTKSTIVRQLNENAGRRRRELETTVKKNEKSLHIKSKRAYDRGVGQVMDGRMELSEDDEGRGDEMNHRESDDEIDIEH